MMFTSEITLGHLDNFFKIGFAVLNFIQPEKNRYAYKLDAPGNNWHYTKQPYVVYNNLAPGKYTLLVKGANNDGVVG